MLSSEGYDLAHINKKYQNLGRMSVALINRRSTKDNGNLQGMSNGLATLHSSDLKIMHSEYKSRNKED